MRNPTKTINRLHFEDIDPNRFEDLCFMLVYSLHPWKDIRGQGRSGSDAGVDIVATEHVEDIDTRTWYIQCKRYQKATASTLISAIKAGANNSNIIPDVFLLIVSCDISKKAQDAYFNTAKKLGIKTPLLWTAQTLESKLYNDRPDLLFGFFGISLAQEQRIAERTLIRNIALKKRFKKDFLKDLSQFNKQQLWADSTIRFNFSSVIIHSIDDTSYPEVEQKGEKISSWFKLHPYNFYFNGIEFILFVESVIIDQDGNWSLIQYDENFDKNVYEQINVYRIGRIPYRNIVDYDLEGDEYYSEPHIYCRFVEGGEPYENFVWVTVNDEHPVTLPVEQKFKYK